MQKECRLQKNSDFQKVYKRGKSVANRQLILYYLPHAKAENFRLGISINKKFGHAVARNRMKRLLKEVVRSQLEHIKRGVDIVLIPRKSETNLGYDDLEKSFLHLLRKVQLYKNGK